jgi:hypothetical protein
MIHADALAESCHRVRAVPVGLRRLEQVEWDEFAQHSGASFVCSSTVLRLWRLRGQVMALQFFLDRPGSDPEKIGQCGIAIRGSQRVFLDTIVLKPGREELWPECFAAATSKAGPGRYCYGSNWNVEANFPEKILAMPGVAANGQVVGYLDVIDLGRWSTFEAYLRDVSANIRRNLAHIKELQGEVRVEHYSGLAALRVVHHLSALRRSVLTKKYGRHINVAAEYVRHVLKTVTFRRHVQVTLVRHGDKVHGIFYGTAFGPTLHYNSGATRRDINGFGAFLFVSVLRHWFEHYPKGRVVLGWVDCEPDPNSSHFRHKLRALQLGGGRLDFSIADGGQLQR